MKPIDTPYRLRPNWMEVDLDNIYHNVGELRRVIGKDRKLIAVAKVMAYGHGILGVASFLLDAGADVIAVGRLADAINLREIGIQGAIMLFGSCLPQDVAELIVEYDVIPSVWDVEGAEIYSRAARGPMEVYLTVDVGTHRFGVLHHKAAEVAQAIEALPNIHIDHVYTTIADPFGEEEFLNEQYRRFNAVVDAIRAAGIDVSGSCAASALISTQPGMYRDSVRSGNLVYGFYMPPDPPVALDLKHLARAFKSHIVHLQWIESGERLGYFGAFTANRRTHYGVLPLGWTDGILRTCAETAQVLVRGKRCPFIGGFHGEHSVVDVTDVEDVKLGDEVVIFGQQGDDVIELSEHAKWGGVSPLEAVTVLGRTNPHKYFRNGKEVSDHRNAMLEAGLRPSSG